MKVAALTGDAIVAALEDVARLRIAVFAEWPYLYDGDLEYEARYLQTYRDAPRSILVGAYDGERLVGASTGTPLGDHAEDFAAALNGTDLDPEDVFYCAESVLLPQYRGHGIGHRFFDLREDHARALGFSRTCFCAVVRPDDHPSRPENYRQLDAFWRARGYVPLPDAVAQFEWRDLGEGAQTPKPLQFWIKDL
jgi:GNAT superfamily N-acetyltransferase